MQDLLNKKKEIVNFFMEQGILLNHDLLIKLEDKDVFLEVSNLINNKEPQNIAVLNDRVKELLNSEKEKKINWTELEKLEAITEKKGTQPQKIYEPLTRTTDTKKNEGSKIKVIFSYKSEPKKREAQDFTNHFNSRYTSIKKILKQRLELANTTSISRLYGKRDREQISIIGMIRDKQLTKNGNYMLTLEDETAYIRAIVNKTRPDIFKLARDMVLDEVIGLTGANGDNIIFANNLFFPDIPATGEIKKSKEDGYALFLSDLHVGSKYFLENDFNRFLKWINQELGNEAQRETASKVKYVFVLGDLVDGCGIYPGQDKELTIKDINKQYEECANLLRQIPQNIKLIICPGNHDAMRVAEPQLPIYKDFSEPIYNLPNAIIVSNPAIVNIHSTEEFPGFDVLIYHGYSFDYYVADVDSIRNNGGYDRADLIMKFLLQKRHLAPTHASTLYVPDPDEDPLVINKVPDFFVSGHIHKAAAANYRNVTLLSGSCWQSKTTFQEKVGHNPEPSRVPIINLQTRQIKMLRFGK